MKDLIPMIDSTYRTLTDRDTGPSPGCRWGPARRCRSA